MNIYDNKIDEIFTEQHKKFQRACEEFRRDMDLKFNKMKFNNILEDGKEIIETLHVISADMKDILSDIQYKGGSKVIFCQVLDSSF